MAGLAGRINKAQLQLHNGQHGSRKAVVARITGKREEYVVEGIRDPEDIWGEEAEEEFIEVSVANCCGSRSKPSTLPVSCHSASRGALAADQQSKQLIVWGLTVEHQSMQL